MWFNNDPETGSRTVSVLDGEQKTVFKHQTIVFSDRNVQNHALQKLLSKIVVNVH